MIIGYKLVNKQVPWLKARLNKEKLHWVIHKPLTDFPSNWKWGNQPTILYLLFIIFKDLTHFWLFCKHE